MISYFTYYRKKTHFCYFLMTRRVLPVLPHVFLHSPSTFFYCYIVSISPPSLVFFPLFNWGTDLLCSYAICSQFAISWIREQVSSATRFSLWAYPWYPSPLQNVISRGSCESEKYAIYYMLNVVLLQDKQMSNQLNKWNLNKSTKGVGFLLHDIYNSLLVWMCLCFPW
jgi:hypothetical protein